MRTTRVPAVGLGLALLLAGLTWARQPQEGVPTVIQGRDAPIHDVVHLFVLSALTRQEQTSPEAFAAYLEPVGLLPDSRSTQILLEASKDARGWVLEFTSRANRGAVRSEQAQRLGVVIGRVYTQLRREGYEGSVSDFIAAIEDRVRPGLQVHVVDEGGAQADYGVDAKEDQEMFLRSLEETLERGRGEARPNE